MRRRRQSTSPFRKREALRNLQRAETARAPWAGERLSVHRVPTGVELLALDGVGLAVSDPAALVTFLCGHVGMHVLDRTPDRTLVGAGDRAATLTLVAAQGPREAGALGRLILRVADVERAVAALGAGTVVEGDLIERAGFEAPGGLRLGFTLVAGGGIDYDVDHLRLCVSDPEQTRIAFAEAGFVPRARAVHVADKYIALSSAAGRPERSLLDHIAVRVASVQAVAAKARERGLAIDDQPELDACAIVLGGAEQIRLRFVEQSSRA